MVGVDLTLTLLVTQWFGFPRLVWFSRMLLVPMFGIEICGLVMGLYRYYRYHSIQFGELGQR